MNAVLFLILVFIGLLFAWPIRGTLLGHSVGAMLPGAILGLATAMYLDVTGNEMYLLAAAGAVGCYYGGKLSYIETCDLVYGSNPPENFKLGMIGLAIKGAMWFGFTGAVISITINRSAYNDPLLLTAMVAGLPVAGLLGRLMFNQPHNVRRGIVPKIYFSKKKQEVWGGMLLMILYLAAFMIIRGDTAGLAPVIGGIIGGGIGFPFAHYLQFLFRYNPDCVRFNAKLAMPTWKLMEMTFGAIGGLGVAVGVLFRGLAVPSINFLSARWIGFIWILLLAGWETARTLFFKYHTPEKLLENWVDEGQISEAQYRQMHMQAESTKLPVYVRFVKYFDNEAMTALYCFLPMLLIFSGNWQVARVVSCSLILYVAAYRAMNRFSPTRAFGYTANGVPAKTVYMKSMYYRLMGAVSIAAVAGMLLYDLTSGCSITVMWMAYTLGCLAYILLFIWLSTVQITKKRGYTEAIQLYGNMRTMTLFYLISAMIIYMITNSVS